MTVATFPQIVPALSQKGNTMKLVRYGVAGREKPGIVDGEGRIRDLSGLVPDVAGEALSPKSLGKLAKVKPDKLPPVRGNPRPITP